MIDVYSEDRNKKWEEDIRELSENLQTKHGNLFLHIAKEAFEQHIENLVADIPNLDDYGIQLRIKEIFALVNDAHLVLFSFESDLQKVYNCPTFYNIYFNMGLKSIYPIKTYWFGQDLRVIETDEEYKEVLGAKLVAINHIDIADIISKVNTLIAHNNAHRLRFLNAMHLVHPAVLKHFQLCSNGKAVYTFQKDNGACYDIEVAEKKLKEIKFISAKDNAKCWAVDWEKIDAYWYQYIPEKKVLYFRSRMFWNKDKTWLDFPKPDYCIKQNYEDFLKEMFDFIDSNEVEKFIIDFRDNNGGIPGAIIAEEVKKRAKVNQKGKLFVIINRGTFSAPIKQSVYLKEATEALFFGEPTGEMPYKGGPAYFAKLTHSGLYYMYSKNVFEPLYEGVDTIQPDFYIEPSFDDYQNGIDTILETIIDYKA